MSELTINDLTIVRHWSPTPGVVFVEAHADGTRYNCCLTHDQQKNEWWVMIENLSFPVAMPALPHLAGWHWSYLCSKMPVESRNEHTARALALIMQLVHDVYVGE